MSSSDGCSIAPNGVHGVDKLKAEVAGLAYHGGLRRALELVGAEQDGERGQRRWKGGEGKERAQLTLQPDQQGWQFGSSS